MSFEQKERIISVPDATSPQIQIKAKYWEYETSKLQEAFFRDWGRFWNTDENMDPSWEQYLEAIPHEWKFDQTRDYRLAPEDVLAAIKDTRTNTSPGPCQWSKSD